MTWLPEAIEAELRDVRERVTDNANLRRPSTVAGLLPADVAQLRHLVLVLADALDRAGDRIVLLERQHQGMAGRYLELLARVEKLEGPCP